VHRSPRPTRRDCGPTAVRTGSDVLRSGDAGYATAEAAVVLPVLLIVLAMAAWVLVCVNGQLRCVDAARAAARVAARGNSPVSAGAVGRVLAPPGAQVRIHLSPDFRRSRAHAGLIGSIVAGQGPERGPAT